MTIARSDYVERMLQRLADAVARILRLRRTTPEQVQAVIEDTCTQLLGFEYTLLCTFDADSVARLLGEPRKLEVAAALLEQEGWALYERGQASTGRERVERALSLRRHAQGLRADPENAAHIERLERALASRAE